MAVNRWHPELTALAGWASGGLAFPIDLEILGGKGLATGPGLPAGVVARRPDEIDAVLFTTGYQERRVQVGGIDEMIGRQQASRLQGSMDRRREVAVVAGCQHRV